MPPSWTKMLLQNETKSITAVMKRVKMKRKVSIVALNLDSIELMNAMASGVVQCVCSLTNFCSLMNAQ